MNSKLINETVGLDEFIDEIKAFYPSLSEDFYLDLKNDVQKSSSLKIKLERLKNVYGISCTNKCIISANALFEKKLVYFLYILFHELAHQHQYRKYGRNLAMDVYKNKDIDGAIKGLRKIEDTADKFGIMKAKQYEKKFNLPHSNVSPIYKSVPNIQLKDWVFRIQGMIKEKNLKNIEKVEEAVYNLIRTKL
jgi:hypothetical protein